MWDLWRVISGKYFCIWLPLEQDIDKQLYIMAP